MIPTCKSCWVAISMAVVSLGLALPAFAFALVIWVGEH